MKFEISKKASFIVVFNQTAFCFFTAHNPQQLFSQLTVAFFKATAQPNTPLGLSSSSYGESTVDTVVYMVWAAGA
jgi:hypothetical protein